MALLNVYPKVVVDIDTTKTRAEILAILDPVYPQIQARIRAAFAGHADITIPAAPARPWHFHLSTGPVDVEEP